MKNHEPNQTRSVSIGSDQFQTEPNKVGYFFGLDFWFRWFCPNHFHPYVVWRGVCGANICDPVLTVVGVVASLSFTINPPSTNFRIVC